MNILESINKGFDKKYGKLMESCDIKKDECVEEKECDLRHRAKARRRKEDVAVDEACKKEKKAELKEYKNIGQDVAEYQKWVDYDMKRYHKISDKTKREIRDAGLSIVKDQYGDYEVIAKEPVREGKDCDKKRKVSIDREKVVEAIKKEKINGRKKVTEGVRDYSSDRPYESYREVLADGRLLVANLYVERTRTSTYEIADLILDDKKATGKDRWINRPWYRFRFEKAIRSAAIELGIDSKKLADATVDCHSAEEYVKAIARIIDEGSEKSKE